MLGVNTQAYLPLGDLYLEHDGAENFSHYQRELDLDSGIAKVSYHTETGQFTREAWISAPDGVCVIQAKSSVKGGLQLALSLDSLLKHSVEPKEKTGLSLREAVLHILRIIIIRIIQVPFYMRMGWV